MSIVEEGIANQNLHRKNGGGIEERKSEKVGLFEGADQLYGMRTDKRRGVLHYGGGGGGGGETGLYLLFRGIGLQNRREKSGEKGTLGKKWCESGGISYAQAQRGKMIKKWTRCPVQNKVKSPRLT